jgi:hypothetical protein
MRLQLQENFKQILSGKAHYPALTIGRTNTTGLLGSENSLSQNSNAKWHRYESNWHIYKTPTGFMKTLDTVLVWLKLRAEHKMTTERVTIGFYYKSENQILPFVELSSPYYDAAEQVMN